jgi:outer membrane murein-binding lipoprotein Lpp
VKNMGKFKIFGILAFAGGLLLAGCKSAPPLSQSDALALIQAKYDQASAAGVDITVKDPGMRQGVLAGYWVGAKRYPNGYWADFTLTPAGQKVLKLPTAGTTIEWRPSSPTDQSFSIVMTTVAAKRLKARDVSSIEDGAGDSKTAKFSEDVDLTGVPAPLQAIAHDPGNLLSQSRTANFTLVNGAWQLQSIN